MLAGLSGTAGRAMTSVRCRVSSASCSESSCSRAVAAPQPVRAVLGCWSGLVAAPGGLGAGALWPARPRRPPAALLPDGGLLLFGLGLRSAARRERGRRWRPRRPAPALDRLGVRAGWCVGLGLRPVCGLRPARRPGSPRRPARPGAGSRAPLGQRAGVGELATHAGRPVSLAELFAGRACGVSRAGSRSGTARSVSTARAVPVHLPAVIASPTDPKPRIGAHRSTRVNLDAQPRELLRVSHRVPGRGRRRVAGFAR
jgi:hypothetical protein